MTDFSKQTSSYVDTHYGLNRDRVKQRLDSNVAPDISLDGMIAMARRYPIDEIGEFYGIIKDEKGNLSKYMDKNIVRDDHIAVVEDYFRSIGMPIPGGFKKYQEGWIQNNNQIPETDVVKAHPELAPDYVQPHTDDEVVVSATQSQKSSTGATDCITIKKEVKEIVKKVYISGNPTPRGVMMMEWKKLTGKKPSPKRSNEKLEQEILLFKSKNGPDGGPKVGERQESGDIGVKEQPVMAVCEGITVEGFGESKGVLTN